MSRFDRGRTCAALCLFALAAPGRATAASISVRIDSGFGLSVLDDLWSQGTYAKTPAGEGLPLGKYASAGAHELRTADGRARGETCLAGQSVAAPL